MNEKLLATYKIWFLTAKEDLRLAKTLLEEEKDFYPHALPGITPSGVYHKNEAEEAVKIAEEIVGFVSSKIK